MSDNVASPMTAQRDSRPDVDHDVVGTLRAAGCVFAEDEAVLLTTAAATPADLTAMVARRVAGEPLEYVLGWAEFCELRMHVEPGVFVPRRRTEFLVGEAVAAAARQPAGVPPVVVDLCCGTGAVGAAVAAALGQVLLHAADVDAAAVRCARRNLPGAHVYEGDLFEPLPTALRGRVDLLVANAPYVPSDAIRLLPPEARDHEPRTALDGGADGLDLLRRVIAGAPGWLAPGGHVVVEASDRQAPVLRDAVVDTGLDVRVAHDDEIGANVVIGRRAGA